jgi:hypothetical protein
MTLEQIGAVVAIIFSIIGYFILLSVSIGFVTYIVVTTLRLMGVIS